MLCFTLLATVFKTTIMAGLGFGTGTLSELSSLIPNNFFISLDICESLKTVRLNNDAKKQHVSMYVAVFCC